MVALSFDDKERVYYHLGMGARIGIDAGDLAQVEEACNTIFSDNMKTRIVTQLNICDDAFKASQPTYTGTARFGTKENYQGDINRAILRESDKDFRMWAQNYQDQCQELANLLHVPNYRQEGWMRYMFPRSGAAYINALPGVADTSVASRRLERVQLAGSFGY